MPESVSGPWIREHEWILRKVLLDEAFAADLAIVRRGAPESDAPADVSDTVEYPFAEGHPGAVDRRISKLMGELTVGLPLPGASVGGAQLPDVYRVPQEAYERELERLRARRAQRASYQQSEERLVDHFKNNILHYCRAIWSHEDPERRQLRFKPIRVPVRWEYIPGASGLTGTYEAQIVNEATDLVSLADLIQPAGPIGFAGNYSVFLMRAMPEWERLHQALAHLRMPYRRVSVGTRDESPRVAVTYAAVQDGAHREEEYLIEVIGWNVLISALREADDSWQQIMDPLQYSPGAPIEFDGVKIVLDDIDPASVANAEFRVSVRHDPFLEDPDLRQIRWDNIPPTRNEEGSFYTDETIEEIAALIPNVAAALASEQNWSWGALTDDPKNAIRASLHEFLLKREHTRRFLLETNNVLLDLEVGVTPALEDFKRVHRYVDALRAFEEAEKLRLENARRQRLLDADKLGDPEIERITILADNALSTNTAIGLNGDS